MPEELVPGDVEQYTGGRLSQTDPETVRALNAALARVRRYCGWHVSPVRTETITLDGNGGSYLLLPTLKPLAVLSVTEEGLTVALADVKISANEPGVLAKKNWQRWKDGFGNIVVQLQHGYTAAQAEDFREAVLSLVDRASLAIGTEGAGALVEKEVANVRYKWSDKVSFVTLDESAVSQFRILPL